MRDGEGQETRGGEGSSPSAGDKADGGAEKLPSRHELEQLAAHGEIDAAPSRAARSANQVRLHIVILQESLLAVQKRESSYCQWKSYPTYPPPDGAL